MVKLSRIAILVKGRVYGKKDVIIKNILPPDDARESDLTFLCNPETPTQAGAVVASSKICGKNGVVVRNPKDAMFRLLRSLEKKSKASYVSASACVDADVRLPVHCVIEPFSVVGKGVVIGEGTVIGSHCVLETGVVIGKYCRIHSGTTIYSNTRIGNHVHVHAHSVIGKEGFGYIKKRHFERMPHIGGVLIEDYVEIGGNVTVDRGTIGDTVISDGTKIDNLVHIAHNVRIGRNCIIMGQSGIAGSTTIGNNVTLCGQVGVSDHLNIGDNVIVYAKSAVLKSIPSNLRCSGNPAREHTAVLRALARLYKDS